MFGSVIKKPSTKTDKLESLYNYKCKVAIFNGKLQNFECPIWKLSTTRDNPLVIKTFNDYIVLHAKSPAKWLFWGKNNIEDLINALLGSGKKFQLTRSGKAVSLETLLVSAFTIKFQDHK